MQPLTSQEAQPLIQLQTRRVRDLRLQHNFVRAPLLRLGAVRSDRGVSAARERRALALGLVRHVREERRHASAALRGQDVLR